MLELGRDGQPSDPAQAFYHYAVAVRLMKEAGLVEDAVVPRHRRATLARLLPPEIVAGNWRQARAFVPDRTK